MAEGIRGSGMVTSDVAIETIVAMLSISGVRPPVVLIDGRSGAGKSTFASQVATRVPMASIIRLDDIYPGWHGLEAAHELMMDQVLQPLEDNRPARWQRWDWVADVAAEWVPVDAGVPVIIEGVGALTGPSRALADFAVWIELDEDARKSRALGRDGDRFAPHWDQWARDEGIFMTREQPRDHADVLVDGRTIAG